MVTTIELIGALVVAFIILMLPYMLKSIFVKLFPKMYDKLRILNENNLQYNLNRFNEFMVDNNESSSNRIRSIDRK